MFTWGVEINKVRETINEITYFGLGLDNVALVRVLSLIEPHIGNKEKTSGIIVEEIKTRKGSL